MSQTELPTADKLHRALCDLREEYRSDDHLCPWVVGFSGGKDSTLLVQLVFEMLLKLPPSERTRPVVVLSNDTLVESPVLALHQRRTMAAIAEGASSLLLPVTSVLTQPSTDQTFWVNLIGRGYPAPNRQFRWCTDRLKIQPTSRYIKEQISASGEVILLLGVRTTESATRAATTRRHTVKDARLHPHTDLSNCFVFRPILDFTTECHFLKPEKTAK